MRPGRHFPSASACLALLLTLGGAGAAVAETLADAVALAYANNPELNRQRMVQRQRDENYVQARSEYGPTLNAEVTGGYRYRSQAGQSVNDDNNQATLTLSQPIYTFGRLRGQLASARATVTSGQEQLRSTEQNTVRNVVIVYASVLRDQARLDVGRENVAVLRDQLRENQARRRVGDVTLTDVGQADARLAAAESQLATLEATLAVSRGEYLQVIGQNPGTLAPLPDLEGLPETLEQALRAAEDNNPDLSASRYNERASSANAAAVRGAQGPTISANVQGSYFNRLYHFDGREGLKTVTGGLTLTQPLFAAGQIRSRVRSADAANLADQLAIDEQRRTVLQAVTSAWSQLAAARTSLVSGERQVASAQLAFAGMTREQRFGLRTTIDVLNAEQELQAAQLTFLQNRYTEYVSRASLLVAMGAFGARAITTNIDTYDPNDNFRRVRHKGMTPLEPIAMGLDRIGSAAVRRPLSANLTGEFGPTPNAAPALPPTPSDTLMHGELTPMTQSKLVPASERPFDANPNGIQPSTTPPPPTAPTPH